MEIMYKVMNKKARRYYILTLIQKNHMPIFRIPAIEVKIKYIIIIVIRI